MVAKLSPQDNSSNAKNANKGTAGTNRQYDQLHGNRGKQMNPNQNKVTAPAHRAGRGR